MLRPDQGPLPIVLPPSGRVTNVPAMRLPILACTVLLLAACGGASGPPEAKAPNRYPVAVEVALAQAVQASIAAPGHIEAFEVVGVPSRVAGTVERLLVREGDQVAAGQVVAEIDPARFALLERQLQAVAQRAEAAAREARAELARREELSRSPGLVAASELDALRARSEQAVAELERARADLALASLDRERARPVSPVAGVV